MLNRVQQKDLRKKPTLLSFDVSEVLVIESFENGICEWGVSFAGMNPEPHDYFAMPNKQTAFRLADRLTKCPPISGDKPIGCPSNEFIGAESIT